MIIYDRPKPKKSSKYGAKKVSVDGIEFDSQKEARRWKELRLLERAGKIANLERQVRYILIPAQYEQIPEYSKDGKSILRYKKHCVERACEYIADFIYREDGKLIVEDSKGVKTKDYIIKRKLMLHEYGIRIKET